MGIDAKTPCLFIKTVCHVDWGITTYIQYFSVSPQSVVPWHSSPFNVKVYSHNTVNQTSCTTDALLHPWYLYPGETPIIINHIQSIWGAEQEWGKCLVVGSLFPFSKSLRPGFDTGFFFVKEGKNQSCEKHTTL